MYANKVLINSQLSKFNPDTIYYSDNSQAAVFTI